MSIRKKIEALIVELERDHDFDDEFYQTYCHGLNGGDISDWANSHFDDNVSLGYGTGQADVAEYVIGALKSMLQGESE